MAKDEELLKNVTAAKSKRHQFAFVAKGSHDGALVIAKSKVSPVLITDAKKKSGGTTVYTGACFGEAGKLVFELDEEPPPTLDATLKKVIHEATGLTQACVCRRSAPASPKAATVSAATDGAATSPKADKTGAEQTVSAKSGGDSLQRQYVEGLQAVEPAFLHAIKLHRGDTAKMRSVFEFARSHAAKQEYDKALQALAALHGLIDAAKKVEAKPSGYDALREDVGQMPSGYDALHEAVGSGAREGDDDPRPGSAPASSSPYDQLVAEGDGDGAVGEAPVKPKQVEAAPAPNPAEPASRAPGPRRAYVEPIPREDARAPQSRPPQPAPGRGYVEPIRGSDPVAPPGPAEPPANGSPVLPKDGWDADLPAPRIPGSATPKQEFEIRQAHALQKQLKPVRIRSTWGDAIALNTYQTVRTLGAGAFGETQMLKSTGPDQPDLVLKIPLNGMGARDLAKESACYEKVGEHPRFCKSLGIAQTDGKRGLLLEFVKGKSVTDTMARLKTQYDAGKISHAEYWSVVQHTLRQTLEAIAHLDACGLVHNDIRMDNIMCDATTGQLKVVDFGMAVKAGEQPQMSPVLYGTVSPDGLVPARDAAGNLTSAPEGTGVSSKHDVFSVGATAYAVGEGHQYMYESDATVPKGTKIEAEENRPLRVALIGRFREFVAEKNRPDAPQAIKVGDGAVTKAADGKTERVVGRAGAATEYTKFVNRLLDPDSKKRLSPADALKEPFLADSMLDETQAAEVLQRLLKD